MQEKAIIALNSTSLRLEDLLELWRKVNSSRSDISDVREKVMCVLSISREIHGRRRSWEVSLSLSGLVCACTIVTATSDPFHPIQTGFFGSSKINKRTRK